MPTYNYTYQSNVLPADYTMVQQQSTATYTGSSMPSGHQDVTSISVPDGDQQVGMEQDMWTQFMNAIPSDANGYPLTHDGNDLTSFTEIYGFNS